MRYFAEKIVFPNKNTLDCIVIPIFEQYKFSKIFKKINDISNNYILNILEKNNIKGKINQNIILYKIPNVLCNTIIIVGCGIKNSLNREKNKLIINNIINIIKKYSFKEIYWYLTDLKIDNCKLYWNIRDTINIIEDNIYSFDKFKKQKLFFKSKIKFVITDNNKNVYFSAIEHGKAINLGIKKAKNIANLPPNICTPKYLSLKTEKLTKQYNNISVEIINEKMMQKIGMNAYLSVSKGSKNKPYISIIKYQTNNKLQPIVLLGKGVTFDSGGISLKPSKNMEDMKYDMCGAAAIYGTIHAIAKLNLSLNVIAILACGENMPSSNAYRPSDVIKTMSGITVEIKNTDAEGRLILCDILTYIKKYNPKYVIDIATLTGACVIALGNNISGLMSNNKRLSKKIIKASLEADDRVWELPINDKKYFDQLKSNIAHLVNSNNGVAGAITAACFLSKFATKYKWAHIDIAGTAWYYVNNQAMASGRPINMLCQFLINQTFHNK
ncbi:leucyl aminopeptidase [Enterobacteriaceae endosymbiont of Donacia bicoloricornis]|uniref:leucyl aminopeptidase n=1 Tax=Enterobacteriaceae endosymbiont of Donacia bicoloricornis TaxID=2675772 RepID=UPI001449FD6D|nr:leucyl aminopeptidase [Enterobacteriaceae endosymbiont of Donacia bicoloricornis]QJC37684.1 leucyl aminopeptidase [Enterobacteriaceae endosymbiont of Donacia bicoloricornis]